jgi:hypothetical protein
MNHGKYQISAKDLSFIPVWCEPDLPLPVALDRTAMSPGRLLAKWGIGGESIAVWLPH